MFMYHFFIQNMEHLHHSETFVVVHNSKQKTKNKTCPPSSKTIRKINLQGAFNDIAWFSSKEP